MCKPHIFQNLYPNFTALSLLTLKIISDHWPKGAWSNSGSVLTWSDYRMFKDSGVLYTVKEPKASSQFSISLQNKWSTMASNYQTLQMDTMS